MEQQGVGDWYSMTPDGEVQTQNQDNPGFDHFDIHAIGDFGEDENSPFPGTAGMYQY